MSVWLSLQNLVTLNNCTISNNQATQRGAGIHVQSSGLFINDSTISGNFSESMGDVLVGKGGGIYSNSSPDQIDNSLVSGNRARLSGGIYSVSGNNIAACS